MQKGAEAMHRFDYSFLENGMLPAGLLNITTDIYSLRAMSWSRKDQFSDVFTELAYIAKVQSVKSSNAVIKPFQLNAGEEKQGSDIYAQKLMKVKRFDAFLGNY